MELGGLIFLEYVELFTLNIDQYLQIRGKVSLFEQWG
jgi:hypothetical protein